MQEVEMTPAQLMQERRKFKMPRSTFRVLTLNGVTTVAANDEGKFYLKSVKKVLLDKIIFFFI